MSTGSYDLDYEGFKNNYAIFGSLLQKGSPHKNLGDRITAFNRLVESAYYTGPSLTPIIFLSTAGDVTIPNDYGDRDIHDKRHVVLLSGDCIVDVVFRKNVMHVAEYIKQLKKANSGDLFTDRQRSFCYPDKSGDPHEVTIDYLVGEYLEGLPAKYTFSVLKYDDIPSAVDFTMGLDLSKVRKDYLGDAMSVAELVQAALEMADYVSSLLTFKADGNCFVKPLTLPSEEKDQEVVTHHVVVLCGECVFDLLHRNKIMHIRDYIKELKKSNPDGIRLDTVLSSALAWEDGEVVIPTVQYLLGSYLKGKVPTAQEVAHPRFSASFISQRPNREERRRKEKR